MKPLRGGDASSRGECGRRRALLWVPLRAAVRVDVGLLHVAVGFGRCLRGVAAEPSPCFGMSGADGRAREKRVDHALHAHCPLDVRPRLDLIRGSSRRAQTEAVVRLHSNVLRSREQLLRAMSGAEVHFEERRYGLRDLLCARRCLSVE